MVNTDEYGRRVTDPTTTVFSFQKEIMAQTYLQPAADRLFEQEHRKPKHVSLLHGAEVQSL